MRNILQTSSLIKGKKRVIKRRAGRSGKILWPVRPGPTKDLARPARERTPVGPGQAGPVHWAGRPVSRPAGYQTVWVPSPFGTLSRWGTQLWKGTKWTGYPNGLDWCIPSPYERSYHEAYKKLLFNLISTILRGFCRQNTRDVQKKRIFLNSKFFIVFVYAFLLLDFFCFSMWLIWMDNWKTC